MVHELAGRPAPRSLLVNIPRLVAAYYTRKPDVSDPAQRVLFGTSGHRGSALKGSFNESHILAIAQAICDGRRSKKITGPLFLGMDTHALSEPALASALEVFAANGISLMIQEGLRYTPTPVISHAIVAYNRGRTEGLADGVVITPSHNPPEDGGFKYNPPEGGPAGPETTRAIEQQSNAMIADGLKTVRRISFQKALHADTTHPYDYVTPYVEDLKNAVEMERIAESGVALGVDPLGGAALEFFERIGERYALNLRVVNRLTDPTFSFMTVDYDGKIRMDCSSPYAMARLIELKERFDVSFATDTDADRHGIVTRASGLLNPNHYLSAAVWYLFQNRPGWRGDASVGKTLVSTSMIDRVAACLGRRLYEVPVGFKWFTKGFMDGSLGFAGEESAGASFLRRDGGVWTTDKDGILMDLLAAEMRAKTGRDPGELYGDLEEKFGRTFYERIDVSASPSQKAALKRLSPDQVTAADLAGEPITARLTRAPATGGDLGGIKVVTPGGWFAVRPSGTEDVCKIYTESLRGEEHLRKIQEEAMAIVHHAYRAAGAGS